MFGILEPFKVAGAFVVGVALTFTTLSAYHNLIGYPAAEKAAREGYVQLAEKTALQAELNELTRQRAAADTALSAAIARAETAKQEAARAQAAYDQLVAQDSGDDGARVDGTDLRWLHDH